jgi:hypothetical protein
MEQIRLFLVFILLTEIKHLHPSRPSNLIQSKGSTDAPKFDLMTDLSKIDILKARPPMSKENRSATKLERADLSRSCHGQTLPHQLGHRLRNVFETPETREPAFDSLLKQISSLLP